MKTITNHLVTVLFLSALMVSGNAAAALFGGDDGSVLWKSGNNLYIKYAKQDSDNFGSNDHPVELDPQNIVTVLEELRFQAKKSGLFSSGKEERVFSVTQARRLAEYLAIGLKEAEPNQDIIFTLQKEVSQLLILTDHVFVSGRAFYKDGRLNIIIGDYNRFKNQEYERVYDSSGQLGGAYNFNHGRRSSSANNVPGAVVNMAGIQNKVVNNNPRQDWFVLDIDQAASAIAQQKGERGKEEGGMSREMRLEAARMQKEQRELKLEMARMREQMKNSGGDNGGKSPEERLETLEKLYEQEMISKEEYETKREQILSDI
ncbi:hypothetical protein J2T55_000584 [Methylohalomonas lacus]|uniref:SHOCT domain-containing protein n=1 Tax=Methylohalomonas lacus TaxID=398773 RepID=A0AAE3HHS2_9GAMM|nr:hypothetical protein [Methylohalomonas lacus]MCS3902580.1 hypothetical protein [Methylohalomonas lacus]